MKPSSKLSLVATTLLVLALFASACSSDSNPGAGNGSDQSGDQSAAGGSGSGASGGSEAASQGVTVQMSDTGGQSGDTEIIISLDNAAGDGIDVAERETTVQGDALATEGVRQLLNRLPDLEAEQADQVDFNRPAQTRPRPRPGTTVDQPFPPPADSVAPETTSGPLEVLRYQPEGPVDLAPFISITFNQPMVALSTVTQVEAADVPISITPEMPGRWIWLGAKTVRFEYEPGAIDRIPAATNYVVEIPAGTTAANGAELSDAVTFEFSTPTPQVELVTPLNDSMSTEPLFFIRFDQRVDPDAVLASISLSANGDDVALRVATGDEVNEDTQIATFAENALPNRWLAIRPISPLPTGADLRLDVGPNVPSLEGPELSSDISTYVGRTYGPFGLFDSRCGWDECRPGTPFELELSNPIDTDTFDASMVTVEPAIPGMQIGVNWNQLSVRGLTSGRTTYQVSVSTELTDIFGQTLAEPIQVEFQVGDAESALFRPGQSLVTLDPIVDDQRLSVSSINNDELDITVYAVDPTADWQEFVENQWELSRGEHRTRWDVLGQRRVAVGGEANTFAETAIDLASELERSAHLVVVVAPASRNENDWRNEPFAIWVQRTRIGLDAIADNQQAVARVTDLTTGLAIEGADVEVIGGGSGTTDADGLARIDLANRSRGMLAQVDGERALIGDFWAERWNRNDQLRWYILDDRGIYKPGETARLKGWVRQADNDVPADLSLPTGGTVTWFANDAFGNEIGTGQADLTAQGGFDLEITLPKDITLGRAGIQFSTDAFRSVDNGNAWHELNVQEFRTPDFEVTTQVTDPGPHLAGAPFTVEAQADYFAGGAIASSPVDWTVTGNTTSYSPPKWPDYTFGVWCHGGSRSTSSRSKKTSVVGSAAALAAASEERLSSSKQPPTRQETMPWPSPSTPRASPAR